ncbi:MAG: TonB-dependent receptor [Thiothrix sp.]|nr:TonB-dependent receptor [Thiothrix sp.]
MKTPIYSAAVTAAFGTCLFTTPLTPSQAAEPAPGAVSGLQEPIEIVITAGRKPQSISETLAPVTVITRQDIEARQADSVAEVLRQVPGLSITNNGGLGKQTAIHLRGTNDKHVLVLVDGIRIGSATLGSTAFENLPLEQIERIEVVRGPRSSLYGSEAIGGVIQLFTRKGSDGTKGIKPQLSIGYGSHDTRKAALNLSAGDSKGSWFNLDAATLRTDGFNVLDYYTDYPPPDYAPTRVTEPDRDGHANNSLSLRAGHRFANDIALEFSALQAQGDNEFDGAYQNMSDFRQQVLSAKLTAPIGAETALSAQIGQARDDLDSFKDGVYSSTFNTRRDSATLQADTRLGNTSLSFGLDFLQEKIESNYAYAVDSRDNTGLFLNSQFQFDRQNRLDFALRHDDNEQFGTKPTGSLAFGHTFSNGVQATLSYGTAFKAPTFNDLYYPNSGNPDLQPETSRNIELGLNGIHPQGDWFVNVFQNHIDDLIEWQDIGGNVWQPMNVDSARIRGLELGATAHVGDWRLAANATLQQPQADSGINQGNTLQYRPERILNLDLDRRFGSLSVGASVHGESKRHTDAYNSAELGGFGTLDLRARYDISPDWKLGLKIGNVLDKDYALSRNYRQDGINTLLTLDYQP